MTLTGVDVSGYQGDPGAWITAAGEFDFAAVKVTELEPGGIRYYNPAAAADWSWLTDNGKGRIAYLFGHPSVSVEQTADFFCQHLDALGVVDGDAIGLDLETNDGSCAPAVVSAWARAVQARIEATFGRTPLLYTFIAFAQAGNCDGLAGYPLWLADPSQPAGQPSVPRPWKTWAIHQYDITDPIDRDVASFASLEAMQSALGKKNPAKPKPDRVVKWETSGHWSLNREAAEHHTTAETMLALAQEQDHAYGKPMRKYISRGDFDALLPAGTWLYAYATD
jgi:GH25 family lysozyme M1 (1,4-beta-N-acetylmuramidase)